MKKETLGGPVPAHPSLGDLVRVGLQRVSYTVHRWQQRSDQIRALEGLLDREYHELRDMGLSRDAIRAEISALRRGL